MPQEDAVQNVLIKIITERLDKFEKKLDTVASTEDCKDLKNKVEDHCLRLRTMEKIYAVKEKELEPILKNWDSLNIKVGNIDTQQKLEASKLALMVGAATFFLTLLGQYVWNAIFHNK